MGCGSVRQTLYQYQESDIDTIENMNIKEA